MAYSTSSPRTGTQWDVVSDYTSSFVSPLTYLLKPEVRNKIFDAYREDTLFDLLIHSGRSKVTGNTTFRHFEHDSLFHIHTVESKSGTSGAGNAVVITLEEADHLQTGTLSQIKKKDLVIVYTAASGAIKGYVTDKSTSTADAHTVTIKPIDTSVDLVTATAAADKIGIFSSGASDGAGMTDATSRLPVEFSNYVQIIDTAKKIDGSESANVSFVQVDGKPYYYSQMVVDGDLEQRMKIEGTFIFGHKGSLTDPVTSKTAYFTGGLEYWADTEGYLESYSSNFALADLQNVCKNLDLERAPEKQLLLVGNVLNYDIDDYVKGKLDNTAIDWSKMGVGNAAGRMIDFGVDGFRYANFTFMKKKFSPFNYIGATGGTTLSPYPTMGFTVPWERVVDPKTGDEVDSICYRYKQNDRGSRFMRFWERGEKITNTDQLEFNWKAEAGLQCALARHINKIKKA